MIKFHSLQSRLLVAFVSLSMVICFFFIRLSTLLIDTAEQNAFETILMAEQTRLTTALAEQSNFHPLYESISVFNSSNSLSSEYKNLIDLRQQGSFTNKQHEAYVFSQFSYNQEEVYLLLNLTELSANQHLSQVKALFLYSASIGAVILCLLSSWYLSKLLSKPIEQLRTDVEEKTKTGKYISSEHDKQSETVKFSGRERKDEIGELSKALEYSYSQVQMLLKREQNFTRDVSHELRTPITIIKNVVALKQKAFKNNNEQKETFSDTEISVVSNASKELEDTVEVLLALARQENLHFSSLRVLPIIERTVLNIYQLYPDISFDANLDVDEDFQVTGNAHLIALLFQNLVNNALYHGNIKTMLIYVHEQQLFFENTLESTNQRPEHKGLGHGQYLVRRIAEEMEWKIHISNDGLKYRVKIDCLN